MCKLCRAPAFWAFFAPASLSIPPAPPTARRRRNPAPSPDASSSLAYTPQAFDSNFCQRINALPPFSDAGAMLSSKFSNNYLMLLLFCILVCFCCLFFFSSLAVFCTRLPHHTLSPFFAPSLHWALQLSKCDFLASTCWFESRVFNQLLSALSEQQASHSSQSLTGTDNQTFSLISRFRP